MSPVKLGELLGRLDGAVSSADAESVVVAVTHDSRRVAPGSVFVAIRGYATDGNQFAEAALRKGAAAVVSEAEAPEGQPWIRVPDARRALAVLSAAAAGDPARRLELVGITGTNGKTTTAHLVDVALRGAGRRTGLLGTVQYRVGDRMAEAVRTTPEASDLQGYLREMADAGCSHAVVEVSSHSLALDRVFGCEFRVAVFTNLTRDHLDFHGDMDRYFAAKRVLFDTLLRADGHAVLNADDPRAGELAAVSRGRVTTYGLSSPADVSAGGLELSLSGTRFRLATPAGSRDVTTPLLGAFNVSNLLGAIAASLALDLPLDSVVESVSRFTGVPGRMQRVEAGQEFTVIVDYAHTDDALRHLLDSVRLLGPRRLITVFGCGGDRDRTKRPLMGNVASRLSDVAVVTSDNPRSEPPEAILDEIESGMSGSRGAERHRVPDRREAIALALSLAGPGDAVVIAGKGHEAVQILRDRSVPFDDCEVARSLLARPAVRGGKG